MNVGYYKLGKKVYKAIPLYEGSHFFFSPYLLCKKHLIHSRPATATEQQLVADNDGKPVYVDASERFGEQDIAISMLAIDRKHGVAEATAREACDRILSELKQDTLKGNRGGKNR